MHEDTPRENASTLGAAHTTPASAAIQLATPSIEEQLAEAKARAAAAEHELRLVRDRYDALVSAAAHISWTTLPDGLVEDSPLWRAYTGQTRDEVRGEGWLDAVHPRDRARTLAAWQQAVERQTVYESEYRLRRADGAYHTFLDRGIPVTEPDGSVREWVGICVDIEDHKQTERALDTHLGDMSQLRELVTRFSSEDVQPLLRSVLRAVVDLQGALGGALLLCDPQHQQLTIAATIGFSDEYLAMVGPVPYGIGASGTVVVENRPVVIEDVRQDPRYAPYLAAADFAGYRTVTSLPLRATDGSVLGALNTYFSQPHRPSKRESALVDIYAHHAALLIEQAQLVATSQRASTEAAVQASRLASVFDSIEDAVFVYDTEGRILMANQGARQMLSLDARPRYATMTLDERRQVLAPSDLRGRPLADDRGRPVTRILRGESLPSGHAEEMVLHLADGHGVCVSISGAPVRGPGGEITGAVVVMRDITEQIRLRDETRTRAAELEAILDTMPDAVSVLDRSGKIVRKNRAYRALLAADEHPEYFQQSHQDRLAQRNLQDDAGRTLEPDERPSSRALHGETLTGASALEVWCRLPWGPALNLSISGAPIRDAAGEITGAVLVSHDVTERHHFEARTRESLAALIAMAEAMVMGERDPHRLPDELFGLPINPVTQRLAVLARQVLGCERVGIVSLDADDRMSPIAAVGLTEEQLPGWWQSLDGLPMERFIGAERMARLRDGEQVLLPLDSGPLRKIAYGGPTSLASPLVVDGTLIGAMAIDYELGPHAYTLEERRLAFAIARLAALVVERERLERERATAQTESLALQETNRRMQEFLSVAGHELKTPVTVIKANSQMLARWSVRHGGLNPHEGAMLARTERQVERLMRLVNDLLDVTRIREGRLELRPAPCDLLAITLEAVSEQREIAPDRTIVLRTEVDTLPLVADADRIGQVVTNYLTNALKYSEARHPVRIEASATDGHARIAVHDSGPGIPTAEIPHVWDEFRRVPGVTVLSGSGVGLGLGLHISREIIERHGGTVGVESTPGQGSTFWFTLPLRGNQGAGEADDARGE